MTEVFVTDTEVIRHSELVVVGLRSFQSSPSRPHLTCTLVILGFLIERETFQFDDTKVTKSWVIHSISVKIRYVF